MNSDKPMIYIAAPFFNPTQLHIVQEIENQLIDADYEYFSPRLEGVLLEMTEAERVASMKDVYDGNIKKMEECSVMIAVVDGRDTGTTFEMGYFTKKKMCSQDNKLITFTNEDFGLNVMIQQSVDAHLKGIVALKDFLSLCNGAHAMSDDILSRFNDFHQGVY